MKKILILALLLISGSAFAQADSLHTKARFGAKGSILYRHVFDFTDHYFSPPAIAITRTGNHAWQEIEISHLTLSSYFGSVAHSDIGIRLQYNYYLLKQTKVRPYVGLGVTARRTFYGQNYTPSNYYSSINMQYSVLVAPGAHINFGRKFFDLSVPLEAAFLVQSISKASPNAQPVRGQISYYRPLGALYIRAGFGIWF